MYRVAPAMFHVKLFLKRVRSRKLALLERTKDQNPHFDGTATTKMNFVKEIILLTGDEEIIEKRDPDANKVITFIMAFLVHFNAPVLVTEL